MGAFNILKPKKNQVGLEYQQLHKIPKSLKHFAALKIRRAYYVKFTWTICSINVYLKRDQTSGNFRLTSSWYNMLDMLQPFSTSISLDAWLALTGCCAEVSCQYRILKHRKISSGPRQIGSGGVHTYLYGFPLTIAALHVAHFATQLSSLIMDANHFCSNLFFSCPTRIEPLLLARSQKYLGYKTEIQMWKQMQNSPLCYDFFLASYSE